MSEADAVFDSLQHADFVSARRKLAAVAEDDAHALELRTLCTVLEQPFTYALAPMLEQAAAEAAATQRSLAAVRAVLSRLAGRVHALVDALTGALGARPAFAPDVSALEPSLDGTLKIEPEATPLDLVWLLRQEWTRLNWLLVGVGARELALPSAIGTPPEPLDYLDTLLSARFNLLMDQTEGNPLTLEDDLDRGMAESRWGGVHGTLLRELPPELAAHWLDETAAAVAVLRWLDGELASPFDDV